MHWPPAIVRVTPLYWMCGRVVYLCVAFLHHIHAAKVCELWKDFFVWTLFYNMHSSLCLQFCTSIHKIKSHYYCTSTLLCLCQILYTHIILTHDCDVLIVVISDGWHKPITQHFYITSNIPFHAIYYNQPYKCMQKHSNCLCLMFSSLLYHLAQEYTQFRIPWSCEWIWSVMNMKLLTQ